MKILLRIDNLNSLNNITVQNKITQLIEQLNNRSASLQSILISSQPYLQLKLNNADIQQINIPRSMGEELAKIVQDSNIIKINFIGKHIELEILPKFNSDPKITDSLKLHFNKAQLISSNTLQLSLPVKISGEQPIVNNTEAILTKNNLNQLLSTNQLSIKDAASHFLREKTNVDGALSKTIKVMQTKMVKLIDSFNIKQNDNLPLSKVIQTDINQLIALSSKNDPNNKLLNTVAKLISQFQQLEQTLNYSQKSNLNNIKNKIQSNGTFLESNLIQNKLPFNTSDLKLNAQNILQSLELLIKQLTQVGTKPLIVQRLINDLSKQINITSSTTKEDGLSLFKDTNLDQKLTLPLIKNMLLENQAALKSIVKNFTKKQELNLLNIQRQFANDILNETTKLINKIENNQLLSIRNENANSHQYLLDLPFLRNGEIESFELLVEASKTKSNNNKSKSWRITVKFDLQPLGPMFAHISLINQRISTHFFAQEESTALLLSENIKHLKESLFNAGLEIDTIKGQQGIVPEKLIINNEQSVDIRI